MRTRILCGWETRESGSTHSADEHRRQPRQAKEPSGCARDLPTPGYLSESKNANNSDLTVLMLH